MITQQELKDIVSYCETTGVFVWKVHRNQFVKIGAIAGSIDTTHAGKKYLRININGQRYKAHHLAHLYVTGLLPVEQMDHEDGNGLNNSWANVSVSSAVGNARNHRLQANNNSGQAGVHWQTQDSKWISNIGINGSQKHLGIFANYIDAVIARLMAEYEYGYHFNHGQERPL